MALAKHNGAKFFSRDDLLGGKAFRTVDVSVGAMTLRLRHMTADEMMEYVESEREDTTLLKEYQEKGETPPAELGQRNMSRIAHLICSLAVDGEGSRVLQDEDAEDLLSKVSASILTEAFRKVIRSSNAEAEQVGEK